MKKKTENKHAEETKLPTPRSIVVFQTLARSGFDDIETLASRCSLTVESTTNALNELKSLGLISRDPHPTRLDAFIEPNDACRYLERMGYAWLPSVGEFQRNENDFGTAKWRAVGTQVIRDADTVAKLHAA